MRQELRMQRCGITSRRCSFRFWVKVSMVGGKKECPLPRLSKTDIIVVLKRVV